MSFKYSFKTVGKLVICSGFNSHSLSKKIYLLELLLNLNFFKKEHYTKLEKTNNRLENYNGITLPKSEKKKFRILVGNLTKYSTE